MITMRHFGLRASSIPNLLGEDILLQNHKNIWRVGSSNSFNLSVPQGYKCSWQIVDSRSLITVASGTGTLVSRTFSAYTDTDGLVQCYDIVAIARKGFLQFKRRFRRAITMLPALFTRAQANAIWDFSAGGVTYRDNNFTDRTGYKVWCEGIYTGAGYLGLEEWVSSNPELPVHFLAAPGTVVEIRHTGTNWALRINRNCQNILWDGMGDPDTPYGFKFSCTGANAQMVYMETADSTSTLSNASKNIHLCGVHIDGNGTMLGAGLEVQTYNSGATAYGNWTLDGVIIHDVLIENPQSEGTYFLRFDDSAGYAAASRMYIYRIKTFNTGADGIQFGLCNDSEVHDCEVTNAGTKNDPNHKNGMQWNPGAKRFRLYRNKIYSCKNTVSANIGVHGGDAEVHSNLFINRTVGSLSNIYLALYQNVDQSTIDMKWYNNTIIAPNGSGDFPFYIAKLTNAVTTEFNKLVLANNLLVDSTTTQYQTLNNPSTANFIVGNYITTNIATPKFIDQLNNDFRLDPTSPAYGARLGGYTPTSPFANEDVDGYEYDFNNNPVRGCYSGASSRT